MRDENLGQPTDDSIPAAVGMTPDELFAMYRLLAIAKVLRPLRDPEAHAEVGLSSTSLVVRWTTRADRDSTRPGRSARPRASDPVAVETFHALKQRQTSEVIADADDDDAKVNLLNWDGRGCRWGCRRCRRGPRSGHD